MTCTFEDTSATANSCGDCQARAELYNALCDAGETADQATIEADTVCEPAACEVVYDTCNDPCEPLCVDEGSAADITATVCDVACTAPVAEQRVCENVGTGCAWVEVEAR